MSIHNLSFRGKIRKIMYTTVHVHLSFSIYKSGIKGVTFTRLMCGPDDYGYGQRAI